MPLSDWAKDKYVSQHLSELTSCGAGELCDRPDQSASWVTNFVANSAFRHQVESQFKQFAFAYLRRSEMAYVEYDLGRESLLDYLENSHMSAYFTALCHFEAALSQLWQALEYIVQLTGAKVFEPGDGSVEERLNRIHNQGKHLEQSTMHDEQLHPVWITNDGLRSSTHELSFSEIEDLLLKIGAAADLVSNPGDVLSSSHA